MPYIIYAKFPQRVKWKALKGGYTVGRLHEADIYESKADAEINMRRLRQGSIGVILEVRRMKAEDLRAAHKLAKEQGKKLLIIPESSSISND